MPRAEDGDDPDHPRAGDAPDFALGTRHAARGTSLAVGVDLVEVARIREARERHGERFLGRVFTAGERADCGERVASLAARFAAKEAAAKALGTGIGAVGWRHIEVRTRAGGQPALVLHAAAAVAARALGLSEWHVSLSHTRTLAVAYVVAYRSSQQPVAGSQT